MFGFDNSSFCLIETSERQKVCSKSFQFPHYYYFLSFALELLRPCRRRRRRHLAPSDENLMQKLIKNCCKNSSSSYVRDASSALTDLFARDVPATKS